MTAAEWAIDDEGNEWPITGAWCAACGMPCEPGDVAHPSCLPPRQRGIPRKTEREIRWGLLYDELGAVPDLSRPCSACGKPLRPNAADDEQLHLHCWAALPRPRWRRGRPRPDRRPR